MRSDRKPCARRILLTAAAMPRAKSGTDVTLDGFGCTDWVVDLVDPTVGRGSVGSGGIVTERPWGVWAVALSDAAVQKPVAKTTTRHA